MNIIKFKSAKIKRHNENSSMNESNHIIYLIFNLRSRMICMYFIRIAIK